MTMHCDIVSAEKEIFSGEAEMVIADRHRRRARHHPGHAPLLTGIKPGPVRLKIPARGEELVFVQGGYLEVQPHRHGAGGYRVARR